MPKAQLKEIIETQQIFSPGESQNIKEEVR